MPPYAVAELATLRQAVNVPDAVAKGRALEDFVCFLFSQVPGVSLIERNQLNEAGSEEIDIGFWNDRKPDGLPLDSRVILIECKNWSQAVGSKEVAWFFHKLTQRALTEGVLVAALGITGEPDDLNRSHRVISQALAHGRKLIVLTLDELDQQASTEDLVHFLKLKLLRLTVRETSIE